ncbi:MAG: ATP-binding protein [Euryarchaeota archaeon]|nr:ATP-binding protein [Euryarchaeota archaeon]MBU4221665.1 ATP-binding protein [Euryarchaeota archaeon]MBU4340335.1 ATP-binding protein [Euryarchaeota archaeon]MBU4453885.1 ATP-binding protein [Euryarchaeota archaeon]MCG2737415.1 ATP-binding protein [Candidatus Methanoperedenaceae archaeon]
MIISVASGKGGTGKTTIATNLALSITNVQLLDCDAEEPDCHLFLNVGLKKVEDVYVYVPVINKEKCDHCGKCSEFCQYNAIAVLPSDILIFPVLCHGCGGCKLVCPGGAITEEKRIIGTIEGAAANGFDKPKVIHPFLTGLSKMEFYQGLLNIGEPMATPVIKALKKRIVKGKNAILDSPPGTSCPVIETIRGTDYCLLVTEPTPFGLHDLKLAIEVVKHLKLPFGIIINRDGIGDNRVEKYCEEENIPVLMKIPQNEDIAKLYSKGQPFVLEMPGWKEKFVHLHKLIQKEVKKSKEGFT